MTMKCGPWINRKSVSVRNCSYDGRGASITIYPDKVTDEWWFFLKGHHLQFAQPQKTREGAKRSAMALLARQANAERGAKRSALALLERQLDAERIYARLKRASRR